MRKLAVSKKKKCILPYCVLENAKKLQEHRDPLKFVRDSSAFRRAHSSRSRCRGTVNAIGKPKNPVTRPRQHSTGSAPSGKRELGRRIRRRIWTVFTAGACDESTQQRRYMTIFFFASINERGRRSPEKRKVGARVETWGTESVRMGSHRGGGAACFLKKRKKDTVSRRGLLLLETATSAISTTRVRPQMVSRDVCRCRPKGPRYTGN